MQLDVIFFPLIISFISTALATPIVIPIIKKFKLIDDPKTHKHPALLHKKPVPRGGGIPLFFGVAVAGFFFLPPNPIVFSLFLAALIALVVGTLDDRYDLSRYFRLGANIVCAIIVVSSGISFPFITNPLGGILHLDMIRLSIPLFSTHLTIALSQVLALLWIVWVMNMLNWSKGVDGQMPGIVAISAFIIGLLSLRFPLSETPTFIAANLSFMITGASLGFLIFNFYPAKIFPGYGATAIYLLLASVSLLSSAKLATAILVMGVPMVDGIFTIGRRILSGRSPFWGDKKHLHHMLLQLGFSQRFIAFFYWSVSAILGAISLTLSSKGKLFAIIMLGVVVTGTLLFLHVTLRLKKDE